MKPAVVMTIIGAFEESETENSAGEYEAILSIPEIRDIVEPKLGINSESYLRFYLSKMVDAGYLSRMGRGLYKLADDDDPEFETKFQPCNMPDKPIWRRVERCDIECAQEPVYARWISRTAAGKGIDKPAHRHA